MLDAFENINFSSRLSKDKFSRSVDLLLEFEFMFALKILVVLIGPGVM